MTPYRLEFSLPGLPKTTNAKRGFGHWAQYYRESKKWKRVLLPYLTSKKPPEPLQKAKLTLSRCSSQQPDFDGLVSSFKHIIDALVEAKILIDDRMDVVGQPNYLWFQVPRDKGYIRVVVEELFIN
jgi:hypothetical protein